MALALFILGLLVTIIALKFFFLPYLWLGLTWTVIFLLLFKMQKKASFAALYINLAVIVLFLTGSETYFWWANAPSHEKLEGAYWTSAMFTPDAVLGYVPQKNAKNIIGKRFVDDKLIYAMAISTDQHGLRISYKSSQAKEAVLFFGCSFTFGVGVNDNQTLPYLVGLKSKGQVKTYNFAYGGYGPQQMLSALEQGLVEKIVLEQPKYAFYVAILGHIDRSAGLTSWNVNDPKYDLDDNGEVYYAGHFNDKVVRLPAGVQLVYAQLGKSHLWQKFRAVMMPQLNEKDIERYIKIVLKAKTEFEKRYPGAQFHIIYWNLQALPIHQQMTEKLLKAFQQHYIPVHLVDKIIPDIQNNQADYLIENDGHPNPKANDYIANYIVSRILLPTSEPFGKLPG